MPNENISSAEMTASWRCKYPQLSGDELSIKLASPEGIKKAHEFEEKFQYPLIGRKISVRARWFLEQAINILSTGKYDSCISLGSGFSLLTYFIALAMNKRNSTITYYDIDLDEIIHLREKRLASLPRNILDPLITKNIHNVILNLEKASQEKRKFCDIFPDCKAVRCS